MTDSMTGTSASTPTTVESAAPDWKPKRAIAAATVSSKKLLAPITAEGPAAVLELDERRMEIPDVDRHTR
jgi:hypothetical protein